MLEVLIRRLSKKDKKLLCSSHDTQGCLHGFYGVREYTGKMEVVRVWQKKDALSMMERHQLYKIKRNEFLYEYKEVDWQGCDVAVRLRLRIDPMEDGFAKWLCEQAVWDSTGQYVLVPAMEAVIQADEEGYGIAAYVRDGLKNANLALLKKHGAKSWPCAQSVKLRQSWLSVDRVEIVKIQPHSDSASVKGVSICPGVELKGKYRLLEKLGQGGMGQVWKAEDTQLQINVAIKVLAENADKVLAANIRNEAKALSRLAHNNIANMRGYNEDGPVAFMVMDLVEGASLEDKISERGGVLLEEDVDKWLKPIASAIDYVHEKGLVHRDIKPLNVMIGRIATDDLDVDDRPFLCDFGIASRCGDMTRYGWASDGYRAPEVQPGIKISSSADVYSFAVMVYRCLTGVFPCRGDCHVVSESPIMASVKRGLSKDPSLRPKRCMDLLMPLPPEKPDAYELIGNSVPAHSFHLFKSFAELLIQSEMEENHASQYLKIVSFDKEEDSVVIRNVGKLKNLLDRVRRSYWRHHRRNEKFFNEAARINLEILLESFQDKDTILQLMYECVTLCGSKKKEKTC